MSKILGRENLRPYRAGDSLWHQEGSKGTCTEPGRESSRKFKDSKMLQTREQQMGLLSQGAQKKGACVCFRGLWV